MKEPCDSPIIEGFVIANVYNQPFYRGHLRTGCAHILTDATYFLYLSSTVHIYEEKREPPLTQPTFNSEKPIVIDFNQKYNYQETI